MSIFSALSDLANDLYLVARGKGWHPNGYVDTLEKVDAFIPIAVANIHGEVSELWEAYRANKLFEPCDKSERMSDELTCAEEELADIVIRACDVAVAIGVDIGRAVRIKNEYNKTRPNRHGGKRA